MQLKWLYFNCNLIYMWYEIIQSSFKEITGQSQLHHGKITAGIWFKMNSASLKPACGIIIPVNAEEPGLILPLLTLARENGEVWCWDTWIIWRRAGFDSGGLVAWHSGWANKSGWKSGLISSDVLLRSRGLYSISVPSWDVHRCAWHVSDFDLRYRVCFGQRTVYAKICEASWL